MRATINVAPNVARVGFRIPWCRHDTNPTSIATTLWAIQRSPNVCSGPGFYDSPTITFSVPDCLSNVLVCVISHIIAFTAKCAIHTIIPSRDSAAQSNHAVSRLGHRSHSLDV